MAKYVREELKVHKTECNICGSKKIIRSRKILRSKLHDHVEEVYEERCDKCRNLCYGFSRPYIGSISDEIQKIFGNGKTDEK